MGDAAIEGGAITARRRWVPFNLFWWTDNERSRHADRLRSEVSDLCNGRLASFDVDVYPQNTELIKEIRSRSPPKYGGPNRWHWYFADVPFLLASRPLWRWIGESQVIWYVEWDVAWTGNLGTIFRKLSPPSSKFGLGLYNYGCMSCNAKRSSEWQGCVLGNWSSFGNIDNPVRQHICTGTIQLTWYSPRLLRELAQSLTDKPGDLLYCEANAATACAARSPWGCQIDTFGTRVPGAFGRWASNAWEAGGSTDADLVAPYNAEDRLYHAVKRPEMEGVLPVKFWELANKSGGENILSGSAILTRRYGWQRS